MTAPAFRYPSVLQSWPRVRWTMVDPHLIVIADAPPPVRVVEERATALPRWVCDKSPIQFKGLSVGSGERSSLPTAAAVCQASCRILVARRHGHTRLSVCGSGAVAAASNLTLLRRRGALHRDRKARSRNNEGVRRSFRVPRVSHVFMHRGVCVNNMNTTTSTLHALVCVCVRERDLCDRHHAPWRSRDCARMHKSSRSSSTHAVG